MIFMAQMPPNDSTPEYGPIDGEGLDYTEFEDLPTVITPERWREHFSDPGDDPAFEPVGDDAA
jgi:hypothetical protein